VLKAVIDTNVFISALLAPAGSPRQVVCCLESSQFTLFYPPELLFELRQALSKSRLAAKLTNDQVERYIDLVEQKGEKVSAEDIQIVCRDPHDDPFLACAVACDAHYLVTGDKDLLCLKEHGVTKILSPANFLQLLKNQRLP
jgi:uncharacterized protein